MGQLGFFDADRRLAALSAKSDPLEAIASLLPWESFRADIEAVVLTPEEAKKSKAGRKPLDALILFRMLVLQALYNLSDERDCLPKNQMIAAKPTLFAPKQIKGLRAKSKTAPVRQLDLFRHPPPAATARCA